MQYKDMKEMTIEVWNGKPFMAYVTDDTEDEFDKTDIARIEGFVNGHWLGNTRWCHAYPVDLNKPKPKLMTNRQLAEWLAQGNGLYKYNSMYVAYSSLTLILENENETVDEDIKVRLIGSEEWIEPTTNLLKGDN